MRVWGSVLQLAGGAALGLIAGFAAFDDSGARIGAALVGPVTVALVFLSFLQIDFRRISLAFIDRRFLVTILAGQFLLLPPLALGLALLLPDLPGLRFGAALVLLAPCIDWFIPFSMLAGGCAKRALVIAPVLLLVQAVAVPLWLGLLPAPIPEVAAAPFFDAFLRYLLAPLLAAIWVERLAARAGRDAWLTGAAMRLTMPLVVILMAAIFAGHGGRVIEQPGAFLHLLAIYGIFILAAALLGWALAVWAGLSAPAGRTLLFSLVARNSFVVLPFAFALESGRDVATLAIVAQSMVELGGLLLLLRLVRRLLPLPPP